MVLSDKSSVFRCCCRFLGLGIILGLTGWATAQPTAEWAGYGSRTSSNGMTPALPQIQHDGTIAFTEKVPTVVLLKTDMLLEGTITPTEGGYQVQTEFGNMTVAKANVERLGSDREDIYRFKQAMTLPDNAQELMKLAEWCLKNGLKEQGIAEYNRAKGAAPNEYLVKYIEERLAALTQVAEETASLESDLMLSILPAAEEASESGDNEDHLGLWSTRIPRSVLDSFSKKVQPILLKRCGAADCHGSQSESDFQLLTTRQHGSSATLRNLRTTLKYLDPDRPEESPLLTYPSQIHGRIKPIFSKQNRAQYDILNSWVVSVVGSSMVQRHQLLASPTVLPQPVNPIVQASEPVLLPQRNEPSKAAVALAPEEPNGSRDAPLLEQVPVAANASETEVTRAVPLEIPGMPSKPPSLMPAAAPAEQPRPLASRDPFDPGAFNRRYH